MLANVVSYQSLCGYDAQHLERRSAAEAEASQCESFAAVLRADIKSSEENLARIRAVGEELGYPVFAVSAATHQGFEPLLKATSELLETLPPIQHFVEEVEIDEEIKPGTFDVVFDGKVYEVTGSSMDHLLNSVNFDDEESLNWFHRTLRRWGVIDALRAKGAQEGDSVVVGDMEFDFVA